VFLDKKHFVLQKSVITKLNFRKLVVGLRKFHMSRCLSKTYLNFPSENSIVSVLGKAAGNRKHLWNSSKWDGSCHLLD